MTTIAIPAKTATTTIATYASPPSATLVGTYLNLYVTDKLYAELVNYALPLGFGFRSAEKI